ncbi:peptide/nickel transport system ATP-binding protein [Arthrobacter pigmenti]|uniref:Peptide/nickel transport system ATP-binding protein n=1 Tax=Arthrobacter pigmenti TaxID=271432 RepID=A0A846RPZ7_9MICC|nr:ABC transporter ATP-binding protein [Arthrobacter pigmenti]NJC23640.1 peptide/nickel transport system ATP-binding protein [Arthrobacter pigmenti]
MRENQGPAPLLEVDNLVVIFDGGAGPTSAVKGVSFSVNPGETVAIVGESGSGKSTTAMAVIRLLARNGRITGGTVRFDGKDLTSLPEPQLRLMRGSQIGLVPQDPMSNLNPLMKIGEQLIETINAHRKPAGRDTQAQAIEALTAAGIPNPEMRAQQYPHELSGGLRQRALIALALVCRPLLLIADEPTSALDVTVQRTILDQLEVVTRDTGTAVLMITHDIALAAERSQKIIVMKDGKIVEAGATETILGNPQQEYTRALLAAAPSIAVARLRSESPDVEREAADDAAGPLVIASSLSKRYKMRGRRADVTANVDVSFTIPRGKTVAIVGESGSGKTTTSRIMLKLIEPTSGQIAFDHTNLATMTKKQLAEFRQRVQPIFQDPYSSLNPMYTIGSIVGEPLAFYRRGSKRERRERVLELLEQVALPAHLIDRRPGQLSGGQRQRVAIARALALNPELLVCDEPVSALDVIVQAQVLALLGRLQRERGLSYLFISHDLAVVRLISDYVCVMKDGEIVEAAPSEELFKNPQHPYTKALLASIPGNELGISVV